MADAIDLTTKEELATALGVASSTATLPRIVTAASAAIASWLGYSCHLASRTISVVPVGHYLFTGLGQLNSISSISAQGTALSSSGYRIENARRGRIVTDSELSSGERSSGDISATVVGRFDAGGSNGVQVECSSGWTTPGQYATAPLTYPTVNTPADVQQACIEVAVAIYRRLGRDGDIQSASVGGGSVTYVDKHAIPASARFLLAPYRLRG